MYHLTASRSWNIAFLRLCGNWPGIGRLDVLLGKYLEEDLTHDVLTLNEAREILAHFFIKGCEWVRGGNQGSGDAQHYQNIVLGGIDENGKDVYPANSTLTSAPETGLFQVTGLDDGTYYLKETKAPEGYNKLTARQKFIISDANLDATFNGDIYSTGSGVHVVNKTGSMLPETGAAGTAAFIAFGTFTVLGTGVLLVTKKRMSMIED